MRLSYVKFSRYEHVACITVVYLLERNATSRYFMCLC